jgi:hypothetical protein
MKIFYLAVFFSSSLLMAQENPESKWWTMIRPPFEVQGTDSGEGRTSFQAFAKFDSESEKNLNEVVEVLDKGKKRVAILTKDANGLYSAILNLKEGSYSIFSQTPDLSKHWPAVGSSIVVGKNQKITVLPSPLLHPKVIKILEPKNVPVRDKNSVVIFKWEPVENVTEYTISWFIHDKDNRNKLIHQDQSKRSKECFFVFKDTARPGLYEWMVNGYSSTGDTIAYYSSSYFHIK